MHRLNRCNKSGSIARLSHTHFTHARVVGVTSGVSDELSCFPWIFPGRQMEKTFLAAEENLFPGLSAPLNRLKIVSHVHGVVHHFRLPRVFRVSRHFIS